MKYRQGSLFSVVNYILLCGLLLNYGISDSLQPVVSKNYGASKPKRIRYFLFISSSSVLMIGILISLALTISPDAIIKLFMEQEEKEIIRISVHFVSRIWPIFILSGINIVLSSYLTAMQRAFPSTLIAFSRGLVLPLLFLVLIRTFTDYQGVLIVLPLSELTTFCIALYLLGRNSPTKLVESCKFRRQEKLAVI
jgi:Na+-driven multidrug efflux pump